MSEILKSGIILALICCRMF